MISTFQCYVSHQRLTILEYDVTQNNWKHRAAVNECCRISVPDLAQISFTGKQLLMHHYCRRVSLSEEEVSPRTTNCSSASVCPRCQEDGGLPVARLQPPYCRYQDATSVCLPQIYQVFSFSLNKDCCQTYDCSV